MFLLLASISSLPAFDTRQLAVADSNTSLANVLILNNAPGATTAEINSRLASFNELRTLDNNFKLIKASSDTRSSSLQTDAALSSVSPTLLTAFPNTGIGRQLKAGCASDQGLYGSDGWNQHEATNLLYSDWGLRLLTPENSRAKFHSLVR
jgi:hypothetical protein